MLRFCCGGECEQTPGITSSCDSRCTVCSKRWLEGFVRITLYDMKTSALTIRLDPEMERQLDRAARRSGRSRSELVRDAIRRQLALEEFEDLRQRIMPFAEARGFLTDEDIFSEVS